MMECDVSLLDGMLDDWNEEDEDWKDTKWADPNFDSGSDAGRKNQSECHQLDQVCDDANLVEKTSELNQTKGDPGVVKSMLLNDNKAGMTGLDKDRINQIIYEASKGSKFYENERQKEEQMKKRIEEQKKKIQLISAEQLTQGTVEADRLLEDFEQQRDLSRCIVHIDMDAFYAAVEMREDPSLIDKPMAVGGSAMLSTSNYAARKYGVRAAMPGFIAKKLCPDLVIVPTNFDKYTAVSKEIKSVMAEYDPNFCPMSLDEAYLDLTEHLVKRQNMKNEERTVICRDSNYAFSRAHCICDLNHVAQYHDLNEYSKYSDVADMTTQTQKNNFTKTVSENIQGTDHTVSAKHEIKGGNVKIDAKEDNSRNVNVCPECGKILPPFSFEIFGLTDEDAVKEFRTKIQQRTRLTASAGIAPNMMLAKVCSDKNKPNGQYKIPFARDDVMNFIRDLPTRKISGIGKVSEAMLNASGVHTCTDLYNKRGLLYHLYSSISFNYFMRICLGIGSTTVERESERKSMSTERTFTEISKASELFKKLEELSLSLSEDLKMEQLKGKTVSIKIKTVNFQVRTRAHSVKDYTNDYNDILQTATDLLKTEIQHSSPHPLRLRLMGVRMSNLMPENLCQRKKQNTIIGAFKKLTRVNHELEEITMHNENSETDKKKSEDMVEVSDEQKDVVGDLEICLREVVEVKQNDCDKSDIKTANDFKDIDVNESVNSLVADEDVKQSSDITDVHDSNLICNKNYSAENHSVSDIKFLTPFGSKYAGDAYNSTTEVVLEHLDSNDAMVINSSEVDQARPELSKKVDIIDTAESVDSVENVAEKVDQHECVIMETSSEVKSFKHETVVKESKVESLPTSPVIVHSDTRGRVTRSGQVGTPVSGKKSRQRSGKMKAFVQYECPICGKTVLCKNLQGFNEHVDMCLESGSIVEQTSDKQTGSGCVQLNELKDANCGSECKPADSSQKMEDAVNVDSDEHDAVVRGVNSVEEKFECSLKSKSVKHLVTTENVPRASDEELASNNLHVESNIAREIELRLTNVYPVNSVSDEVPCCSNNSNTSDTSQVIDNNETKCNEFYSDYVAGSTDKEISLDIVCDNPLVIPLPDDGYGDERGTRCAFDCGSETIQTAADNDLDNDDDGDGTHSKGNVSLEVNEIESNFIQTKSDDHIDSDNDNIDNKTNEMEEVNNIDETLAEVSKYTNGGVVESNCNSDVEKESATDKSIILRQRTVKDFEPLHLQSSSEIRQNTESDSNTVSPIDSHPSESGLSNPKLCSSSTISGHNNEMVSHNWDHSNNFDDKEEDSSDEVGSLLVCPVCNIGQRSANLHAFNDHVDACLSRGAITELMKEQNKKDTNSLKRSMTTPGNTKPAKKRKTVLPELQSKTCRSIASFFKTK